MTVATLEQRRFGRAEKALRNAADYRALELAWAAHGNGFPEGSAESRQLLGIYQDQAARFAVEAFSVVRSG